MSRLTETIGRGDSSESSITEGALDIVPERGDPTWYVLGLALALFVGFSIYTSVLNARFATTGADLGSYTHMFATTLDGRGWLLNGKYRVELFASSYWGAHFSLTLLLFLPLFALVPSVYTLLIAKSFVLAVSVVILWLLAREELESDRLAGLVTLSYAFNPFLWSAWSFAFQEQVLIPPLLFVAYYAYRKDRTLVFLLFFALVLLTNEFVVFPAVGFVAGLAVAAVLAGRARRKAPAILGAVLTLGVVRYVSGVVIDHFSQAGGLPVYVVAKPLQAAVGNAARVSLSDLVGIVLADPSLLLDSATFAVGNKLLFFGAFMLPVLFLALFDELSLFALVPYLGFAWVFTGPAKEVYFEFGAHYPLYLLPFVYIGVIHLLRRLSTEFERVSIPSHAAFSGAAAAVLMVCLLAGVASGGGHLAAPPPPNDDHEAILGAAIGSIPENASLIAQNDIYPHVATRPNASFIISPGTFSAYERRYGPVTPEYILIDSNLNPTAPWDATVIDSYGGRLGTEYGLLRYQDGIQVFERGYDGRAYGITRRMPSSRYDAADLAIGTGARENGHIVSSDGSAGEYVWFGPYAVLTPGTYTATFRVNVSTPANESVLTVDVAGGADHERIASTHVAPASGWQNVSVEFTLDETTPNVEFRGSRQGTGNITLDSVRVAHDSGNTANATDTANATAPANATDTANATNTANATDRGFGRFP